MDRFWWLFAGVTLVAFIPAVPVAIFFYWLKIWRYR